MADTRLIHQALEDVEVSAGRLGVDWRLYRALLITQANVQ